MIFTIKFLHLLAALSLLSMTVIFLVGSRRLSRKPSLFVFLNKMLLVISAIAIVTGTLLVYPKQFTFTTPWIQAAYLLVLLFVWRIVRLLRQPELEPSAMMWNYGGLFLLLVLVVHDAVTKTTVFF